MRLRTDDDAALEYLADELALRARNARDLKHAVPTGNAIGVMVALTLYRMFAERAVGTALI